MALISQMSKVDKERYSVHRSAECTYSVFTVDGRRYLQIDTYGSTEREMPGRLSQSMQFDSASGARLKALLDELIANPA